MACCYNIQPSGPLEAKTKVKESAQFQLDCVQQINTNENQPNNHNQIKGLKRVWNGSWILQNSIEICNKLDRRLLSKWSDALQLSNLSNVSEVKSLVLFVALSLVDASRKRYRTRRIVMNSRWETKPIGWHYILSDRCICAGNVQHYVRECTSEGTVT